MRYYYQSPATPQQTLDYNLKTGSIEIKKIKEVPNYNPDLYEVKREFANGHDGEKIPLTIMYKKGLKKMEKIKFTNTLMALMVIQCRRILVLVESLF